MAGGRPPIWNKPEDLQALVDDYFNENDRVTLAGLAVHLGIDRKTLYNYEDKDEFFYIIKKARAKVERIYEERAIYEQQPTGVIFALKNMGWADNQKIDHTTKDESINKFDPSKLSDEDLRTIAELQRKGGIE